MKAIIKFTCLLFISSVGFSQSPGGVTGNLHVWWKGDAGVVGNPVTQWTDQSGNGYNLTSGNSPSVVSNDVNGYSAVSFDGSDDYLSVSGGIFGTSAFNNVYTYVVNKTISIDDSFIFYERLQSGDRFGSHIPWGDNRIYYDLGTCCTDSRVQTNWGTSTGEYHIWTMGTGTSTSSPSGTRKAIYRDGNVIISNDQSDLTQGNNSTFYLGSFGPSDLPHHGNIAEMFIYTAVPSTTELQQIHSYLGIKYGITLDQTSATAYINSAGGTIYDCGTGGAFDNYDNDIAGIGRDDDSGLEQQRSTSLNGERVTLDKGGSFSNDLDFIVWGHNGSGLSYTTTGSHPNYTYRLERIWKADVTGTPGSVSVSFELGSGIPNSGNASDYALIADNSDTDFSSGATAYTSVSISGNTLTFSGVNFSDGDHFTLAFGESIVWDGSTWENGSGTGGSPNTSDGDRKMLVTGAGGILNANANVEVVSVSASGSITITSGITLEVNGDITNNGIIIVESGGALVQNNLTDGNTGSGEYRIQRNSGTIVDDTRYQYWASPVSNTSMGAVFTGSNTTDFYYFNEGATNNWASQPAAATMTPGRGYITTGTIGLSNTSDDRSFNGNANNGTIQLSTSSVTSGEFILAGNPYPSAINSTSFVSQNAGISGTLWFWNHSTAQVGGANDAADYATWTGMGSTGGNTAKAPDDYIQSAQGFFVEASSSNPTISFTNDMRVVGNNSQFFKTQQNEERNRLWLSITNDSNDYNQILVGFADDATNGIDRLYDGKKFKAHPRIAFYSLIDSVDFSIQGLQTPSYLQEKRIPLGVDAWISGSYSIKLDSLDNWPSDYKLTLIDHELDSIHDLRLNSIYNFQFNQTGSFKKRFELRILDLEKNETTGIDKIESSFVKTFISNSQLVVQSNDVNIQNIFIYDINGRILHQSSNLGTRLEQITLNTTGALLISVILENQESYKQLIFSK